MGAGADVAVARTPAEAAGLPADADLALYRAKAGGGERCRVFDAAMRDGYLARRALEEEVRRAALGGEFELRHQPQICSARGVPVGAEALLRWRHPARGLLAPGAFLDALRPGRWRARSGIGRSGGRAAEPRPGAGGGRGCAWA